MNSRWENRVLQLNKKHQRKKWWRNIVSVMAVVVVFCTTYALIMNALALETADDSVPFTINGVVMPGEFTWNNKEAGITVDATLHGKASYDGTLPENVSLDMSVDFDDDEVQNWMEQYSDDDSSMPLMAFRLHLYADEVEILLDECDADITLTMKQKTFNMNVMAVCSTSEEETTEEEKPSEEIVTEEQGEPVSEKEKPTEEIPADEQNEPVTEEDKQDEEIATDEQSESVTEEDKQDAEAATEEPSEPATEEETKNEEASSEEQTKEPETEEETSAAQPAADDEYVSPLEEGMQYTLIATDGENELAFADLSAKQKTVLTFSIQAKDTTGIVAESNPSYTLQHFIYFPQIVTSVSNPSESGTKLEFFNTSLGNPNENATRNDRGSLDLGHPQKNELQSQGKLFNVFLTGDNKLKTEDVLKRLFVDEETTYRLNPQISYMSRLYNGEEDFNENYTLEEIWVYTPEEGKEKPVDSLQKSDFKIYDVPETADGRHAPEKIRFTNNPANKHLQETGATADYPYEKTVLIANDSIVRLAFRYTTEGDGNDPGLERGVNFFDYDLTDGFVYTDADGTNKYPTSYQQENPDIQLWAYTEQQGINNSENYSNNGVAKLAFGNANTHTGLGDEIFNGDCINKYNRVNGVSVYQGTSFGLVKSLTYGGAGDLPTPIFSNGIDAPDLFSPNAQVGKTSYQRYVGTGEDKVLEQDYSLGFFRQGGTYTLSYVKDNKTNTNAASNLREFINTAGAIYSNEFWPMDGSASHGTDGHDLLFGDTAKSNNRRVLNDPTGTRTLPPSDVGNKDHNGYFGMSFSVDFVIQPGYCGPLAYWFYGDDDMWVFLDKLDENGQSTGNTKLIADIGGVHSAVGEYVNMWEYVEPVDLDDTESDTYRMTVFYTERGASGSTCYMRFTVPLTANVTESPNRDEAIVFEKKVLDEQGNQLPYDENGQKYDFELTLINEQGANFEDVYDYNIYVRKDTPDHNAEDANAIETGTIGTTNPESGKYEFSLRNGEYIVISNLPDDTYYTIEEKRDDDEQFVTQYQKGKHEHIEGKQVDTLDSALRYDHMVGNPERISVGGPDGCNYVCFTNSPVLKTEVLPGDGESVHFGQEIIYDIEYANDTNQTADVVITDCLDMGLDFVGAKFVPSDGHKDVDSGWWDASNGDYVSGDGKDTISYNKKTRTVVWSRSAQEREASGLVSLKVKVNMDSMENETTEGKYGTLTPRVENQAEITIGNRVLRTNIVENSVWGPFKIETDPGNKTPVSPEEEIEYVVTWKNYQDYKAQVDVWDPLDEAVRYIDGSAKAYFGTYNTADITELEDAEISYDAETHTVKWDLGEQEEGTEGYVSLKVVVKGNTAANQILNKGYVKVGDKPELETNTVFNPLYGYRLPETGGRGTISCMVAGSILVIGAAFALWYTNKNKKICKGI